MQQFSFQQLVDSWSDWVLYPSYGNLSIRRKISNSNLLNSVLKIDFVSHPVGEEGLDKCIGYQSPMYALKCGQFLRYAET